MSTDVTRAVASATVVEPSGPAEWERYYELRWRLLRAPWGQPQGSERDARDSDAIHLMTRTAVGRCIAVGRLHFNDTSDAQIRYMAVDTAYRGQGVGRRLLHELEVRAHRKGAQRVVLDAREEALPFYERCGYHTTGPAHTLYGSIRHWRMERRLTAAEPDLIRR